MSGDVRVETLVILQISQRALGSCSFLSNYSLARAVTQSQGALLVLS